MIDSSEEYKMKDGTNEIQKSSGRITVQYTIYS